MTDDKNLVAYTEYASGLFDIVYSWGRNPIGSTSAGGATIYEENFWMHRKVKNYRGEQ